MLLIEGSSSRPVLHSLMLYGHLVAEAQKMRPVFVAEGEVHSLLRTITPSYFSDVEVRYKPRLFLPQKVYLLFMALIFWAQVVFGKKLLDLKWHGLQIGDIVYDQYLAVRQHARLHKSDMEIIKLIYLTVRSINESEMVFKKMRISAVLLSHRVGATCAAMANAAEKLGLPIYSFGGSRYGTLIKSSARKCYEYQASEEELAPILALSDELLEELFKKVKTELLEGAFNADAKLAFSRRMFIDRKEFAREFHLRQEKRNVFIMLHAFTDYPHSHFKSMLFDDFHDWFVQTLHHACYNKSVNWIIKSHPASRFYPVRDIDWDEIRATWSAEHIVFMKEDADFDTRSICHIGDAVITCLGSAGFELSAMAGVPSITAGDNPYAHSGFALYPKDREAYFKVLSDIGSLGRLSGEKLRRAKASFVFIHRLSRVRMSGIPALSHSEQRDYQYDDSFFNRVESELDGFEEVLVQELHRYKKEVEQSNFRALRTSPSDYLSEPSEYSATQRCRS